MFSKTRISASLIYLFADRETGEFQIVDRDQVADVVTLGGKDGHRREFVENIAGVPPVEVESVLVDRGVGERIDDRLADD